MKYKTQKFNKKIIIKLWNARVGSRKPSEKLTWIRMTCAKRINVRKLQISLEFTFWLFSLRFFFQPISFWCFAKRCICDGTRRTTHMTTHVPRIMCTISFSYGRNIHTLMPSSKRSKERDKTIVNWCVARERVSARNQPSDFLVVLHLIAFQLRATATKRRRTTQANSNVHNLPFFLVDFFVFVLSPRIFAIETQKVRNFHSRPSRIVGDGGGCTQAYRTAIDFCGERWHLSYAPKPHNSMCVRKLNTFSTFGFCYAHTHAYILPQPLSFPIAFACLSVYALLVKRVYGSNFSYQI